MIELQPDKGIPRRLLFMMAAMAGLTVANLYYNQPLLELMRADIGMGEVEANMVTVVTQAGYALGLCLIIPLGDLWSRRRIIVTCMVGAALMTAAIAIATEAWVLWAASLVMGACSVVPQLFMPMAGQYSRPADKARNIGCVLSGLLCGILASRVVSGMVGQWLGWRTMFAVASVAMVASLAVILAMMPAMKPNFSGSWAQLMASVGRMVAGSGRIRVCSVRAALGFGSMLSVWSCMAFRLAAEPFCAGADAVGALGLCGVAGAMVAGGMGRLVGRFGVRRFSVAGAVVLMVAWAVAWGFDGTYAGLVVAIILIDIGLQCLQLSNQSACMIEVPDAANRANTIFMTTYFVGGAMGTMLSALGWNMAGWDGVCAVGALLVAASLVVTLCSRY